MRRKHQLKMQETDRNPEEYFRMSRSERQNRYFSETIKRKIVNDLDRKVVTIAEVCRIHQVSRAAVYKWIYKYSPMKKRGNKMVIEPESDTRMIEQLKEKVKELEQSVGQKQVKIDFLEKMIELTEEDLNIKIKKKGKT